jgi:hypothetical protein
MTTLITHLTAAGNVFKRTNRVRCDLLQLSCSERAHEGLERGAGGECGPRCCMTNKGCKELPLTGLASAPSCSCFCVHDDPHSQLLHEPLGRCCMSRKIHKCAAGQCDMGSNTWRTSRGARCWCALRLVHGGSFSVMPCIQESCWVKQQGCAPCSCLKPFCRQRAYNSTCFQGGIRTYTYILAPVRHGCREVQSKVKARQCARYLRYLHGRVECWFTCLPILRLQCRQGFPVLKSAKKATRR